MISKEYFKVVDLEDTVIAYFAALVGGKQFDIAPASVERVTERNDVTEFEDRAVGFPYRNIDRIAGVEHCASGGYVYRASHQEKVGLNLSLKMPGDSGTATFGRLSANRQVKYLPCKSG